MENSKCVRKIIGERLSMARNVSRQQLCSFANRLAADDEKEMSLNEATLKQWEYGNNRIDIEWIPYLCRALNCDVGYLFGEYPEKQRESADIREKTGLSEDSIMRLREIANRDDKIKSAVCNFLDALLDDVGFLGIAIAYEEFKNGQLNDAYVMDKDGKFVDFFYEDIPLLIMQNKFTELLLNSRREGRISWKRLRNEQKVSEIAGDNLEAEQLSDIARGK